jgi:hypothetical protein
MTATASHNHIVPLPLPCATSASMLIQAPRDLPVSGMSGAAFKQAVMNKYPDWAIPTAGLPGWHAI